MECENCEYFGGQDRDDGSSICDCDGNDCPYEYEGEAVKTDGLKVTVDLNDINRIIANKIADTINANITSTINAMIKNEYTEVIREKTRVAIDRLLDVQVGKFMEGNITIGS